MAQANEHKNISFEDVSFGFAVLTTAKCSIAAGRGESTAWRFFQI